jgi:hypothetical protein
MYTRYMSSIVCTGYKRVLWSVFWTLCPNAPLTGLRLQIYNPPSMLYISPSPLSPSILYIEPGMYLGYIWSRLPNFAAAHRAEHPSKVRQGVNFLDYYPIYRICIHRRERH